MGLWGWAVAGILLGAELGGVAYWRRNRYPRFGFNAWAPTIYAALVTLDCLLGAGLVVALGGTSAEAGAQQTGLLTVALIAGLAVIVIAGLTLFFRWILQGEIHDIPD
ncbi:MAG: hypothetical protein M3Z04_09945 [Chloroflexota bacterium]|nr:hypothetical protein [Chloroflexota bacterium]